MVDAAALDELADVLGRIGRDDLAGRALAAGERLNRPTTTVCVVGEFKQGKSSLINALLGAAVCPVDDDLATSAITVIRYDEVPSVAVVRRDGTELLTEPTDLASLGDWVSERGNPLNTKNVERVEIAYPSALLKQGLVVVDTPGIGGLSAGHAAATLGFLPFADGLLFTSDASAELSAPEVDFLRRALELCPTVLFAQTKIDLYASWPQIMELNRGHLERAGVEIPIVAVSSFLRDEALRRRDRDLNELSRVPELIRHLASDIVEPAKAGAAARSAADAQAIVAQVTGSLVEQRRSLTDPHTAAATLTALSAAKDRVEHLRGPAARWTTMVTDRMAELSNNVTHTFRAGTRSVSRVMDERIEQLTKGDEWDELSRWLQSTVAEHVADVFVELERGRYDVHTAVAELIRDEGLAFTPGDGSGFDLDVRAMWPAQRLDARGDRKGKKAFATSLTTVRGAQGGVILFGVLSTFLPKAAGLLLASNPVLLGIGAVFGGLGFTEDRRRKVQARRQSARSQVRQFLDDVQFEVGNQIAARVRDIQRDLRDNFADRLAELRRTYTDTVARMQADAQRSQAERQQRIAEIDDLVATLTRLGAS